MLLDGRVAWGTSANDISPFNTYSDTFSTERFLARLRLTGDFKAGGWDIQPHAGAILFEETQRTYRDSNGLLIERQTASLGRLTFGPKFRTTFAFPGDVWLQPFFSIQGIWDFKRADLLDIDSGGPVDDDGDVRARFQSGFTLDIANDVRLTLEGTIDGITSGRERDLGFSAQLFLPVGNVGF
jgi:outer membrane autotransporter protein